MSILIDESKRVLVQGITGRDGSFHAKGMKEYGTRVVAGVTPGKGGQLIRSAGSAGQLMAREGSYATLKMPSGEARLIHVSCFATVGQVGNLDHENISYGKAGRKRWLGRLGSVRGVAMNPVDHPMGGGEGKSSGGRHPCSPWGKKTKGLKTRHNKRTDSMIIQRRKRK